MRGVVWFRRDLRVRDNPALSAASETCHEVIPLFVFDQPLLQSHVFGPACVNFMLGCLEELASSLVGLGLTLQWRRGKPVEEVVRAVREVKADVVYWNRDYEPAAVERDREIQERLVQLGAIVRTFKDHVVFEADEVRGRTGGPLQRYSAYRARWWTRWHSATPSTLSDPKPVASRAASTVPPPHPLPSPLDLGYDLKTPWIQPGERTAHERLRWFLSGPVHTYVRGRTRPALDGTSRLSPHFRFGTLSPRTAIHAALKSLSKGGPVSRPDVHAWIDELVWREFFQQVLAAFPSVAENPFRNAAVPTRWVQGRERDRLFHVWCEGRTGYPIVDAGMRQLNRTGWMHNRVRMICASFLIKDLRIDWQSGERYFMHQLIDADVAANNGNWQWCAGIGADAMPKYRIFNPVLQSRKFDPEGAYIRQYVPELGSLPPSRIHEPHLMTRNEQIEAGCRIGFDYPSPVVDHRQAREAYLRMATRVPR